MWWKRRGGGELRRLVMQEWDPLAVSDSPEAADEYDTYVGEIGSKLQAGTTVDDLTAYLTWVREEYIGLGPSDDGRVKDRETAERIIDWYAESMANAET
jgi:hypothetical protein